MVKEERCSRCGRELREQRSGVLKVAPVEARVEPGTGALEK
jgi:hypothetical protein